MKIVANIQVGNEIELIDHHIQYHLALGIDAFVIVELMSSDGTRELLQKYRDDPRFRIRHCDFDDIVDDSGIRTPEFSRWMLDTARDEFSADWIFRIDADEFLFPQGGDLRAVLQDLPRQAAHEIERLNVVAPAGSAPIAIPRSWQQLAALNIMARPLEINRNQYKRAPDVPLNLIRQGAKTVLGASTGYTLNTGGHHPVDASGEFVRPARLNALILAHFWFSSLSRFRRKVETICRFQAISRERLGAKVAWQWSRWEELAANGDDAIEKEFNWQFPCAAQFDELLERGAICPAGEFWETAHG